MSRIKTVILGTGGIAGAHVEAVRALNDRVELAACCDIDSEKSASFARKHGIAHHFTDLRQMLEAVKPDLVQICTPPAAHIEAAIMALEAGAHVWCEKPLCGSLAAFDQISEAEKRTGRWVTTVFQWRAGGMGKHVKRLIEEGVLGRPLVGVCHTLWYRDQAYYQVDWRGRWDNELGGTTLGHGIHLMDLFLWLYGDWESVTAEAARLNHQIELDDFSAALVRFESGARGSIVNSVVSPRQQTYLRLDTERATIEVSALYHYTSADWRISTFENSPYRDQVEEWTLAAENAPSGHTAALRDVISALEAGERPLLSGGEARKALEFASAIYKSAFTGERVKRGAILPVDPFYQSMNGGCALA